MLQNRLNEAEEMFLRAKSLAPNDSTVYQHYGQLAFHFQKVFFISKRKKIKVRGPPYLLGLKGLYIHKHLICMARQESFE